MSVHTVPLRLTYAVVGLLMPRVAKPKRQRGRHFVREWREYRGLSQEQMASFVYLSRENYGRIEAGKVPYNQDFLELAAAALNCSPGDLISRSPANGSAPSLVLERLSAVDAKTVERAAALLKALVDSGD
jgi:transcriptional regulator with XRE-family HTH domain